MQLINRNQIFINLDFTKKSAIFKLISEKAFANGDITNAAILEKDLLQREAQISTGLEDGFAIPHAISDVVLAPKIYIVINKNYLKWKTLDNKDEVKYIFAILVPKNASHLHLKILAAVATKMNDPAFKELISSGAQLNIIKEINNIKLVEEEISQEPILDKKTKSKQIKIVGVTSCAAGIAHTYMARDRILEACKKNDWNCKIETRGTIGPEHVLSKEDIAEADFVYIASDMKIDHNQFLGKRIVESDTNQAIRNAEAIIQKAIKQKKMPLKQSSVGAKDSFDDNVIFNLSSKAKNKAMQALMTAIGFMLPVTIAGGILMSIPNIIAAHSINTKTGAGASDAWNFVGQPFLHGWFIVGQFGLKLMLPIFGMYLAYAIAGRSAMPAALIGTYLINDSTTLKLFLPHFISEYFKNQGSVAANGFSPQAGFLGAIVIGFFVGYLVQSMKWINWPKMFKPVIPIMIIPVLSTFITYVFTIYVAAIPLIFIMFEFFKMLHSANHVSPFILPLIGMLFAGMIAFDLGGPLNKTAYVVAIAIFTTAITNMAKDHQTFTSLPYSDFAPQAAVNAAIGVPPLGAWLATILFKRKFSNAEIQTGKAAFGMGLVGISEGAIPFAITNPIKAITANVVGAVCAGAIVVLFQCRYIAGLGSPLGTFLGYIPAGRFTYIGWIIGTVSGSVITALIFGFWRPRVVEYEEAYQVVKQEKRAFYKSQNLNTASAIGVYNFKKVSKTFGNSLISLSHPKNWIRDPQMHGDPQEYKITKYKQKSLLILKKLQDKIDNADQLVTGFEKLISTENSLRSQKRLQKLSDANKFKAAKFNSSFSGHKIIANHRLDNYIRKIKKQELINIKPLIKKEHHKIKISHLNLLLENVSNIKQENKLNRKIAYLNQKI